LTHPTKGGRQKLAAAAAVTSHHPERMGTTLMQWDKVPEEMQSLSRSSSLRSSDYMPPTNYNNLRNSLQMAIGTLKSKLPPETEQDC